MKALWLCWKVFYFLQVLPLEAWCRMFISFQQKGMLFAEALNGLRRDRKEVKTEVAAFVLYVYSKSNLIICFQVELFNLEKD